MAFRNKEVIVRVLHALHMSLPAIAGYSIRSSYILRFQQAHGIEPVAVTSAQDPNGTERCVIDGVPHLRTPSIGKLWPGAREAALISRMYRSVEAAIHEFSPEIVHAYSPVLVGLPALLAARRHGLPFVYEVRDLWENASVDRGTFERGSWRWRGARELEGRIYRNADAVITICEALRDAVANRVGLRTALHVVPNGVEVNDFAGGAPDPALQTKWGFSGKRVIGYIGTFQPYEGLSTAISAMPKIASAIPNAHLMITGRGGVEAKLREQVVAEGLEQQVTFTGRVPHERVPQMYTLPELFVYPRFLTPTTAITTPLKPLEAMASSKPVLVSNVPAMLELIKPGETGMVFRAGDADDLADKAIAILGDPMRQAAMSKAARAYVEAERQWPQIVARYRGIYEAIPPRR